MRSEASAPQAAQIGHCNPSCEARDLGPGRPQRLQAGAHAIWLSRSDNLYASGKEPLRASRVRTPGLVSTATLPSVVRGGYISFARSGETIRLVVKR